MCGLSDQHCAVVPLRKALVGPREAEYVSEVWLGTEAKDSECVLLWGHPASFGWEEPPRL